ncbi:MAG: hypothetical protein V4629_02970 [Pseudomonadota bacterium]
MSFINGLRITGKYILDSIISMFASMFYAFLGFLLVTFTLGCFACLIYFGVTGGLWSGIIMGVVIMFLLSALG